MFTLHATEAFQYMVAAPSPSSPPPPSFSFYPPLIPILYPPPSTSPLLPPLYYSPCSSSSSTSSAPFRAPRTHLINESQCWRQVCLLHMCARVWSSVCL